MLSVHILQSSSKLTYADKMLVAILVAFYNPSVANSALKLASDSTLDF